MTESRKAVSVMAGSGSPRRTHSPRSTGSTGLSRSRTSARSQHTISCTALANTAQVSRMSWEDAHMPSQCRTPRPTASSSACSSQDAGRTWKAPASLTVRSRSATPMDVRLSRILEVAGLAARTLDRNSTPSMSAMENSATTAA